ncbi:hypothetical protein OBB02_03025 [Candidatus Puniceispirillum sp.]|nr:hypothetical protein [Candidatus Puniceispirillum sp.]
MKQLSFFALVGCSVLLTGCASNDEIVACPVISAPEEGARSFVRSDTAGQLFDVRLNGVTADCMQHKSGGTKVALTVGLKLDRNLGEGTDADVLGVPMMTAMVDDQQTVISNSEFGYTVGFGKGDKQQYPTVEIEKIVPANARLVISLKPAY